MFLKYIFNINAMFFLVIGILVGNSLGKNLPKFFPDGVKNFEMIGSIEGKTYFWNTQNLESNWIQSVEICHKERMFIATIETEAQQKFLENIGEQKNWTKYSNIGGTDLFTEENWRWIRNGKEFTYNNWYPGSPYPDPDGRNWNCLALDPGSGWKWVDIGCEEYLSMTLCEFP